MWTLARMPMSIGASRSIDRARTLDGLRGSVEHGEEAVAGGVELAPTEALQLAPNDRVVAADELLPAPVAEPRSQAPSSPRCR